MQETEIPIGLNYRASVVVVLDHLQKSLEVNHGVMNV